MNSILYLQESTELVPYISSAYTLYFQKFYLSLQITLPLLRSLSFGAVVIGNLFFFFNLLNIYAILYSPQINTILFHSPFHFR